MGCSRDALLHFFTDFYMECPNFHWLSGLGTVVISGIVIGLNVIMNIFVIVMIIRKEKLGLLPLSIISVISAPLAVLFTRNTESFYFVTWVCYGGLLLSVAAVLLLLLPHRVKYLYVIPVGCVAAFGYAWYVVQCMMMSEFASYDECMNSPSAIASVNNYEFGFIFWSVCLAVLLLTAVMGVVHSIIAFHKRYHLTINKR